MDVPVLHAAFHDDVAGRTRTGSGPWQPISAGSPHSPFAVTEPSEQMAPFSVVDLASQTLAGTALLWGVDTHNRSAHLGLSLLPAYRGRGLGSDTVHALCEYGFAVRGLHRLQVETLADNAAMIAAAESTGFTVEGTLRRTAWVYGAFMDVVVLGLLAEEWSGSGAAEG
ncbi:hypothetical protein GCM10010121_073470 [Streptomyces brasiliensis]|uniref:N-acetyltransferase domain-containing protein n=1 Tax=Streptomyces brasiliensis TaxID=1954 RepID=A0A917P385_9ACTN|nr:hypothetical protein GCM10010121_073470 [Streptomyces brasiliensis]